MSDDTQKQDGAAVVVALWQGAGVPGDALASAERACDAMARAAARGARLILFPEGFLSGYFVPGLKPGDLAQIEPALARVAEQARVLGLAVVMGTHLEAGGALHNAAVTIDESGRERGRYVKRALFGPWENATFAPGDRPLRVNLAGLRVGVLICYDVEFPELVRAEARAGVQLVAVCTALMEPHAAVARLMVPTRALENQVFVGYCNRSGHEGDGNDRLDYTGLSTLRGPMAEDLATAGTGPELLLARIDPARIGAARATDSYIATLDRLERAPPAR